LAFFVLCTTFINMKLVYVIILQLLIIVIHAQDVEVLSLSSFKHDYLVSEMQYLEDINDTGKTQYIATLKISGAHGNEIIGHWLNLLNMNAKRLGANLFYVESYVEDELKADLIVKMYFGGLNFITANTNKVDKNKIYIFNQSRSKNDTGSFYMNQKKITFDPKNFYTIDTKQFQLYHISSNGKKSTTVNESFPKNGISVFYIIPNGKKSIIAKNSPVIRKNGLSINFKKNKPLKCKYTFGRFAMEIYKSKE